MSIRNRARAAFAGTVALRGELLVALAVIAGWTALTSAVAHVVRGDVVWRVSVGIFLLSLVGWKLLAKIASHGLYTLSRDKR